MSKYYCYAACLSCVTGEDKRGGKKSACVGVLQQQDDFRRRGSTPFRSATAAPAHAHLTAAVWIAAANLRGHSMDARAKGWAIEGHLRGDE